MKPKIYFYKKTFLKNVKIKKAAPEYSCLKTLYSGGCDVKTCHDKCLSQLKGNGQCADKACRCSYLCKPPPLDI